MLIRQFLFRVFAVDVLALFALVVDEAIAGLDLFEDATEQRLATGFFAVL
jgi:hypothetical protein